MGEQGKARPAGNQTGQELNGDQTSSSIEEYNREFEQAVYDSIRGYQAAVPELDHHTAARLGLEAVASLCFKAIARRDSGAPMTNDEVVASMDEWVARGRAEARLLCSVNG